MLLEETGDNLDPYGCRQRGEPRIVVDESEVAGQGCDVGFVSFRRHQGKCDPMTKVVRQGLISLQCLAGARDRSPRQQSGARSTGEVEERRDHMGLALSRDANKVNEW